MDDHRREPDPLLARSESAIDLRRCEFRELFNAPPIGGTRLLERNRDSDD